MGLIIKNGWIYSETGKTQKDILIKGEKIASIGKFDIKDEIFDARNSLVIPGFIDCHTHGFLGTNTIDGSQALNHMSLQYAKRGVLGFYATIGPRPFAIYEKIFSQYRESMKNGHVGNFLGIHLEGPYLNAEKNGAIDSTRIQAVDLSTFESFMERNQDIVKIMTIAPEIPNALEAIKILRKYHVHVSLGHSKANQNDTLKAIEYGASQVTHLYNAMPQIHHRDVHLPGIALLDDRVYVEMILDGVHVNQEMLRITLNTKNHKKIIAISDGGESCGYDYEDGYQFNDCYIVKDGAVYHTDSQTLCGSTRDVYRHFQSLINKYHLSVHEAIDMTSSNASAHFGLNIGKIKPNYDASLLILEPKTLKIKEVFIKGKQIQLNKEDL